MMIIHFSRRSTVIPGSVYLGMLMIFLPVTGRGPEPLVSP